MPTIGQAGFKWVAWAVAAGLSLLAGGCARAPASSAANIDISTGLGAPRSPAQAISAMRLADHVLLGEVHDNPLHHRERALLIKALADRRPTLVFEQFPRSANDALATPVAGDLEGWIGRAGFDRRGWGWPLHRPLIEAALAAQLRLRGGNLARDEARNIARLGAGAAPTDLASRLAQPLPASAAETLDRGLVDGHCGQLPAAALPRMREAQAARDLAMADALLRAAADGASPTVLIAGNGHVRRDHGVGLWIARQQPAATVLSVGFLEVGPDGVAPSAAERAAYDLVWVTPRQPRPDPCAGFSLDPRPASPAPATR